MGPRRDPKDTSFWSNDKMKESLVVFANPKIEAEFESLKNKKFQDKKLYEFISKVIGELKKNASIGVKIPRKLWPEKYIREYEIKNLWKCNLPGAWRLIYTIKEDEIRIFNILLEWFSHKDYEKRFSY